MTAGVMQRNSLSILLSGLCVLIVGLFLFLFYRYPVMDLGPAQPIAFSHRVHAGVKQIQCQFCHPYVDRSPFPGLPPVEKCLYCHQYIIANHPEIRKEHAYFDNRTPTPWQKVNYLPEHVFFKHHRHIKEGIACRSCHGAVETMDRLRPTNFSMGFCITCHRARKAPLDCWLACHN